MGDTCNKRKLMIRKGAILRTHEKLETSLRTGTVFLCVLFYLLKITYLGSFICSSNELVRSKFERTEDMNTEIREYDKNVQFEIGQRIQKMRIKEGLKSIDLATELGITKNQMSRIENGRANCTIPQLYIIAQILNCSVDYLFFKRDTQYSVEQINAINELIKVFK